MSAVWVTPVSFIACGLIFLLSIVMPRSRARADAEGVALALTASLATYTTLAMHGTWPENVRLYAFTDLAVGLFVLSRCPGHWDRYKVALLALLAVQLAWHAGFWFVRSEDAPIGSIDIAYAFGLSVLGFGQFIAGAWPGSADAVRRLRSLVFGGAPDRYRRGAT